MAHYPTDMDESEVAHKIAKLESDISDLNLNLRAWRGYTKRRYGEFVQALNQNTKLDIDTREIVERLNTQESEVKKHGRSNIVVYFVLCILVVLVFLGKIESGDFTQIALAAITAAIGLGAAAKVQGK